MSTEPPHGLATQPNAVNTVARRQMACERPDCTVPAVGQLPATLAKMSALHTLCALSLVVILFTRALHTLFGLCQL